MSTSRTPMRTASPTLRAIFNLAEAEGISQAELTRRVKSLPHVIMRYRKGERSPDILRAEEMADAIGYELVLRKKRA